MKTPLLLSRIDYRVPYLNLRCLRVILTFLLVNSFSYGVLAQTKLWDKTIGGSNSDSFSSLQQTSDGGYILGGSSYSETSGDKTQDSRGSYDYWVVKIDATGQKQWDKTIGSSKEDALVSLQQTSDGGYILGGYSAADVSGDKSQASRGDNDYWVVKLDAAGNKQWDKTFGGSSVDILRTLQQTSDGGYMLGGSSISGINTDKTEASKGGLDYWIVKLNASGQKEWDKTFGGSNEDDLSSLQQTSDGGFILGGNSSSDISGDKTAAIKGAGDYWILKLDAAGNKVWDKTFGGSDGELLFSLQQTSDEGYILGGTSFSAISGDKTESSRGETDYWVVKLNAFGNKEWDKTLGGTNYDVLYDLIQTNSGAYILAGFSASATSTDKTEEPRGGNDYWIVKLNAAGNKEWDKTLGGSEWDVSRSVQQTSDGNYILGGSSYSGKSEDKGGASKGSADYWIVKLKDSDARSTTVVNITADKDTYIIPNDPGANYGALPMLYIGKTGSRGGERLHRALLHFDLSSIPLGSQIDSASLKLFVRRAGPANTGLALHQVTTKWGEMESTWNHAFAPGTPWKTAGGDYAPVATATTSSPLNWEDSLFIPNLAADVQSWVNKPDTNFGWLVKVPEEVRQSAVLLGSREESGEIYRPALKIFYKPNPNPATWNLRYGGRGIDRFTVAIKTQDGGYLTGGYSNSDISGDKSQDSRGGADYWIVKTDKDGSKQWDKRYGGTNHDYLNRIIPTVDGGYLLAGSSTSGKGGDKSEGRRGDQDYWIVKITNTGEKQWDKTYGGSGFDDLRKVNQLFNGDYLLAGTSDSPVSGEKSQSSQGGKDYWVVRISSTGNKIWDKSYGGIGEENLESFTKTSAGGFLLAGSSTSGISGNKSQASRGGKDYWLVRINSRGSKLWDKSYGGEQDDELYSIGITNSGEYFVAGHSSSGQGGDKSQASQGASDYWMLKLSSSGEKLWDKSFGGSGRETLRSIIQVQGGYVLAGSSDSPISGDKSQGSQGGSDYWIIKTDAEGNKEYDQRFGGSGNEEFRYIQRTEDGGLLLGGRSESGVSGDRTQPSQGAMDYWLVKLAPVKTAELATARLMVEPAAKAAFNLNAYPNPVVEQVNVTFTLPQTQAVSLKVYNLQGAAVKTLFEGEASANKKYELAWQPAQQQAPGLYIMQLQTAKQTRQLKIMLSR